MSDKHLLEEFKRLETRGKLDRRTFLKLMGATGAMGLMSTETARASSNAKGRIVIVGGGAAGISMAARLVRALQNPDITIIDPSDRQYYQPGFTLIASGVYKNPDSVWKDQSSCMPDGVKWLKDEVSAVDPVWNRIETKKNGRVDYDFLVLTPGLQINWTMVEGISQETIGQGNAHCMYDFKGAQRTWKAVQEYAKKGGRGIFTDTYTKHKCGGAPKKICLLTEENLRIEGTRQNSEMQYYSASKQLYDVPFYTPRLEGIYKERNIPVQLHTRVTGVDTQAKKVYLKETSETSTRDFVQDYDFLHFLPPMSAPDFVRQSGLSWTEGKLAPDAWVMADKETLVHQKFSNIISLGDVAGIPTSKTSAAIRIQVPVAYKNLISIMEGKEPTEKYNGYAACPIITEYGKILMCEFDYAKEALPSFPFNMMDSSKELYSAWLLKVYMLKPMYFYGMLNGRA